MAWCLLVGADPDEFVTHVPGSYRLVPGETYRIRSVTATGVIPADYDGIIDDFIAEVSVAGGATIATSSGAPDPGQWVRLVDFFSLETDLEILAPDYRAALIGDMIHLSMEVVLDPSVEIYDWNLAILPLDGLSVSNPTMLETQAASVNDNPPGVRELNGIELTELSTSPTGGMVSRVTLSDAFSTSLGPTDAPHKILRFTLSGPTPTNGDRATWGVGFADALQGSGGVVSNQLTSSGLSFTPFTRTAVFEVFNTIPCAIRKDGGNLVLEWDGGDEEEEFEWDVYSFTEFDPASVVLWQEGVPTSGVNTSLTFPIPGDPRRFFTVVPTPSAGDFGP